MESTWSKVEDMVERKGRGGLYRSGSRTGGKVEVLVKGKEGCLSIGCERVL